MATSTGKMHQGPVVLACVCVQAVSRASEFWVQRKLDQKKTKYDISNMDFSYNVEK